jgi:hypothetical protein
MRRSRVKPGDDMGGTYTYDAEGKSITHASRRILNQVQDDKGGIYHYAMDIHV